MKWEDTGLVLSVRKFSERDGIVSLLTKTHGLWRAMVKGAFSKTNRATYQPGNLLLVRWNARLAEHMGNFSCELLEQNAALLMQDKRALTLLNATCAVIEDSFEERDPHPALYEEVRRLIDEVKHGQEATEQGRIAGAMKHYALFEKFLLAEAGYGLDLSCCAATGVTENLTYISPKTARAVCRDAGAPYHDKMLPFPKLYRLSSLRGGVLDKQLATAEVTGSNADEAIQNTCLLEKLDCFASLAMTTGRANSEVDTYFSLQPAEILDALRVSGYFLQAWLYTPRGRKMPAARERLVEMVEKGVRVQDSGVREEKEYSESRIPTPESL